jgi:NRAMP (natural resistance-associated macrophage protein)-like metal ion transporter
MSMPRLTLRRIWLFLAIIGPGLVTANVDNDAGGIATYSIAGASFGYKLLWTLIPMTLALIIVQEMCARMGAVTGKGLADLIRERFGVKITFFAMIGLLIANFGTTVSEFAGVGASMELFGVSKFISVPLGAVLVWWLVLKGSYKVVERVFLFLCLIYFCYVPSGIMAKPPWGEVMRQLVIPHFSLNTEYLTILLGVIGTTIAPWMQFYIQSAVVEKGITAKDYGYSRLDVIFGCCMTDFIAMFIIVACAATLYSHSIKIDSAEAAAMALAPLAGSWASSLFAIGLLNASIFAAAILPIGTAFFVCEAFGLEAGIDKSWEEAPVFYWLFTLLVILGASFVLIPNASLIKIMLWPQVINGALLPFVLIFMVKLINNKDLMGEYTNNWGYNLLTWTTITVIIVITVLMLLTSITSYQAIEFV